MKYITHYLFFIVVIFVSFNSNANEHKFAIDKDLLLLHFDLKTDVDDVHTIAALDLILQSNEFKKLNYFAVSGTYGIQSGLYVPANELFNNVFKQRWTDLHNERSIAMNNTVKEVSQVLSNGGQVWVAEAGQSDFTQEILKALKVAEQVPICPIEQIIEDVYDTPPWHLKAQLTDLKSHIDKYPDAYPNTSGKR